MKARHTKRAFLDSQLEDEQSDQSYVCAIDPELISNPALVTTIAGKFRWKHFPTKPGDERVFDTRDEALRNRP